MVKSTLPIIWNTFVDDTRNMRSINFHLDGDYNARADVSTHLNEGLGPLAKDQVPPYIHFSLYDLRSSYKDNLPDLFMIRGGIIVVSERFRDLLLAHELGATEFFEVPLYEYDKSTRRPDKLFFINIIESKTALIPEKSTRLEESYQKGLYTPDFGARDVLAVRAYAAEGADLWRDSALRRRLFLTDRLKRAIKDAGIKVRHMPMRKCVVVEG